MTGPRRDAALSPTERRNPKTLDIDSLDTLQIVQRINDEDRTVADAVAATLPQIAAAVDAAAAGIRAGGTVHYFGAGTSGRLAVLDAAELLPTFNIAPGQVVAHHAGGAEAIFRSVENVEDSVTDGAKEAAGLGPHDVAIGIAASGTTPYVRAALAEAGERGATTVLITANPASPFGSTVDILIAPDTGPEAITGSTRLKAGTAQKMVLNTFSTTLMVKLGHTWSNLMVDVVASNAKLRERIVRILHEATGAETDRCRAALARTDGRLKPALVHLLSGADVSDSTHALDAADGSVNDAVESLGDAAGHRRHAG